MGFFPLGFFSSWDFFLHGILSSWDFIRIPRITYKRGDASNSLYYKVSSDFKYRDLNILIRLQNEVFASLPILYIGIEAVHLWFACPL